MRILYHYPLCPFSRKIRHLMYEKKLDFSEKIEIFWNENKTLLKMNAAGTVPILVDLNATIIADDSVIVEYLEEAYPQTNMLGQTLAEKAETRRLVAWFDKKFYMEVSYPLFLAKVVHRFSRDHHTGAPNSQVLRQAKKNLEYHLKYIEWLTERRNWLSGEDFSLSDITAAAHLSMMDYFGDMIWERHPIAKSWYVRVKSRPSFRAFLNDKVPGFMPAPHYGELDF
ncbi:MAG: glutathione S-transferase family protein [Alphaproteobacteria bacterium]|nr:glutathione S-transferase family protein [Alphaproteobacteria bacterium]